MKPISKMDWDIIDARVTKACDRHKFQKRTVGFLAIVIDQIFPGHEDQLQEIITDGPDGLCCAIRVTVEVPLSPDRLIPRPQ